MYSPTQLPIIMGLASAALILFFTLSLSSPLPSLSLPLIHNYSFPAIKSFCVEYVCSMWSLFSRSKEPILITPRNLFLLVNLIILFLFVSLHLQQHAPAAGKRSSRKKRQQLIMKDKQAALLALHSEAAAMEKEALVSSIRATDLIPENLQTEENLIAEAAPMLMSAKLAPTDGGSMDQTFPAVDSDFINGSHAEQIVLDEDGQLRLIGGTISSTVGLGDTNGSPDAENCDSGRLRLVEYRSGSDSEKIVLEEDGQLRLVEAISGSDEDKIVLEDDGRLRLIERPQLPSPRVSSRPQKSLSTGDNNYHNADNYGPNDVNNSKLNYDNHSLNKLDDDMYESLNKNDTINLNEPIIIDCSLSEVSNGTNIIDCSLTNLNEPNNGILSAAENPSLNIVDGSSKNKSSSGSRVRTSSARPIRVKKSDSLEATWKAINNSKTSAANRDRKNLVRQSSRQDFKPSRGGPGNGLMRASNNNNNNNSINTNKVRREPSISQEELNVKVESFIAKFNEQIRIQRQQSLLSYTQMVDRGT